jgi:hypothetical protein
MIVNDPTSWSITLESSIMLLESSIMLPENIYSTGFTHDDHMTMEQHALKCKQFFECRHLLLLERQSGGQISCLY